MKKISLLLLLTFFSGTSLAARFQDQVHSLQKGKSGEDHLILLKSGRVLFINPRHYSLKDFSPNTNIEVEEDEEMQVKSISSIPSFESNEEEEREVASYSPDATVLESYDKAYSIFRGMNRSWRNKSECTDRAQVWTYEEWRKHGLISKKVFLFFTNTYIRRYRFHWWFHVSPYTLVRDGEGVTEYAMDRRYSRTPLTMKSWTDIFIRSKRHCPVTSYSYYRSHKNGREHCFAVKSSMYNRLPYHVRQQEDNGRSVSGFSRSEVNFSYRAFTRRGVRK